MFSDDIKRIFMLFLGDVPTQCGKQEKSPCCAHDSCGEQVGEGEYWYDESERYQEFRDESRDGRFPDFSDLVLLI